jgi:hypothetical protein
MYHIDIELLRVWSLWDEPEFAHVFYEEEIDGYATSPSMPHSNDTITMSIAPHKVRICLWQMYEGRNVGVRDGQGEFSFVL